MKIIPAIDIIDGQCVRLTQGDYNSKIVYDCDAVKMALKLQEMGFTYLHLVDLDGARSSSSKNLLKLNQIALQTNLIIDFGGGVKSEDTLIQAFRSGATQVNIGSLAIRNPPLVKFWIMKYGAEKIIISADVRGEFISVGGWKENSTVHIMDFINDFSDNGASYFVCTDISRDGMLEGPALALYDRIRGAFPDIKIIASGGISTIQDIDDLDQLGIHGAIIGKAIYEGEINCEELIKKFK